MGIPRKHNSASLDWTQAFCHDLCILWDTTNPFAYSELRSTKEWRYPPDVYVQALAKQLSKHLAFNEALP